MRSGSQLESQTRQVGGRNKYRAQRLNSLGVGDYSNYYFKWANSVARRVELPKKDVKRLGLLAYRTIFDPPRLPD